MNQGKWNVVKQEMTRKQQNDLGSFGDAKECSNYCTTVLISCASKGMLKILQARLQQYANQELPDVQAGFQRGRGTRDQIANICFIIEKAREFQKNIYFCFTDYTKAFVWITANCRKFFKRPPYLSPKKAGCGSRRNRTDVEHLVPNWGRSTTRLYIVYLTSKQSTLCKMLGWMNH